MTFEEMQSGILKVAETYSERFNVEIDHDFAVLKLFEEVGEYAQAVIVHKKKSKPKKYVSEEEVKKTLEKSSLISLVWQSLMQTYLTSIFKKLLMKSG